ncbi:MAG: hypothetical protein K8T89_24075 [Planctomycetes bacterium]|nr:hypothetical protein [Planctomycetota bacterium]
MPETEMTPDQVVEAIYKFAAEQMRDGVAPAEIERKLVDQGLEVETAAIVVSNLTKAQADVIKEAGKKNMLYGALWCIGGILVTALTYGAAADGGGKYVVAWGAILFGGIQFIHGLMQSSK